MSKHSWSILAVGLLASVWIYLLSYKYFHLGYYDWDLAFFTQACWQLVHGSQFVPLVGINYFGDHSYFITFLILPFFILFKSPLTLIFLKVAAFCSASFLLYKIASKKLGWTVALVVTLLYVFFPANVFSMLYEFNPESFAPPILFWMFMAFEKKRWRSFVIGALLLMLIKESMALVVCCFGIYGLLNRKTHPTTISWLIMLSGAAVFYVLTFWVIPQFRHLSYHAFVVRYGNWGNTVGEIFWNMLTHPKEVIQVAISQINIEYLRSLFSIFWIPALFGWQILMLISPLLLQHLLSVHPPEHTIYYHYGSTLAPIIFLAMIVPLRFCRERFRPMVYASLIMLFVIVVITDFSRYQSQFMMKLNYHADQLEGVRWDLIETVPKQAGVIASFDYLAPLSVREHLYSFQKIYSDYYQDAQKIRHSELNTFKAFVLPDQVKYALIDWNDPWLIQAYKDNPEATRLRVDTFMKNYPWKIVKSYGSIILLER